MLLGNYIFCPLGNGYYSETHLFIQYVLLSDTVMDAGDTAVSKRVKNFCHGRAYILVGGNRQKTQNILKMDKGKQLVLLRKIK